jgi:hypothetical protein
VVGVGRPPLLAAVRPPHVPQLHGAVLRHRRELGVDLINTVSRVIY